MRWTEAQFDEYMTTRARGGERRSDPGGHKTSLSAGTSDPLRSAISGGKITLRVAFIMPRPKSHYGTGKNSGAPKPSAPTYHTQKPDLDNPVKFVKDCLNGVCWRDDSQVVSLIASKSWGPEGLTEISLS